MKAFPTPFESEPAPPSVSGMDSELLIRDRRRSMVVLFVGAALMNTAMVLASTAASLLAAASSGPTWSGLPGAGATLGTAAGALGYGVVAAGRSRRTSLVGGYTVASVGAATTIAAGVAGALWPLIGGMLLLGVGNGVAQMSRYVAAELYPEERRGFALSTIIWGGTVGAIAGPALIAPAGRLAHSLGMPELSGAFVMATLVIAVAAVVGLALPRTVPRPAPQQRVRVHIGTALAKPVVRLPLVAMVAAQVAMVAVMTMTPVQLREHHHGLDVVGWVLSAHMIGMFALAPLSGKLADRWGGRRTIGLGMGALLAAMTLVIVAPTSHAIGLPIALFLLGYGWNLALVGASSLLSRDLAGDERSRLQGAVDAVVWASSAVASSSAGLLFGGGGYALVAIVAAIVITVPVAMLANPSGGRPRGAQ